MLTHRLAGPDFDALAAGLGSASVIGVLRSAQLSRRFICLRAMLDSAERLGCRAGLPGLDLLTDVQQADPGAVNDVLLYPFTGAWMAHCLRLLGPADGPCRDGIATGLGYLNGIAAAAAIRAGGPFAIDVPVRDGFLYLPTLGRRLVGHGPVVTVRSEGGDVTADGVPVSEGSRWQPVRRLAVQADGQPLSVTLDDIDPYRGSGLPIAPRLDEDAVSRWRATLVSAWNILVGHHRGYAQAMGAGLAAIVPMTRARPNRGVNATSRESFGAAALSPAPDPLTLAVGLLHEFQHGKLNAVLDMVPLCRPDDKRYYAPWRQDPRPLGGLLHGAYAHLGVTDFWRVQRTLPTTPFRAHAQLEFARWLASTRQVIGTLLGSGSLTSAGERFVLGMRGRISGWPDDVPDDTVRLAGMAAVDHRLGWRLRNVRPAAVSVDSLACAWLAGASRPASQPIAAELVDGGSRLGTNDRLDLLNLQLREPGRLARAAAEEQLEPADIDLITENTLAAAIGYRARIKTRPDDLEAWAGLALALRKTGDCPDALLQRPEVVCALYRRLAEKTGGAADPETLARWLGPAGPVEVSGQVVPSRIR